MTDEQVFELAEKIGFQDDFGRWNFTSEKLLDFVFMVHKREWVGLDGEIPGLGLVTEEFYNGMLFAEDYLREKNT